MLSAPSGLDPREVAALARFHPADTITSRAMIALVVGFSRRVMTRWNRLEIEGDAVLAGLRRRGGRGLLTFSNHVSLLDDPLLVSCFGAGRSWRDTRWVAADALNFFGDPLRGFVFNCGKCVPIVRGAGAGDSQPGLTFLRDRLREGDWVQVFPEGGRTRDPDERLRTPFKTGIGRLVDEARPIALAFYHQGMRAVLPIGARFPRRGHTVRVRFGTPVDCAQLPAGATLEGRARWQAIADWTCAQLEGLERVVRGEAAADPDRGGKAGGVLVDGR